MFQIYDGDIDVPQTSWVGNGGSEGRTKAPFTAEGASTIKVRKGKWSSSADYLKDLDEVIAAKGEFLKVYQKFRVTYGWRPDFYLDVIEMLEKRLRADEALSVAGDLAELMPGNAEVLGKAARAFRRLGRRDLALEIFERMVAIEPEGVTNRYELARTLVKVGEDQLAMKIYVKELRGAGRFSRRTFFKKGEIDDHPGRAECLDGTDRSEARR